jgi:hypothetical protein
MAPQVGFEPTTDRLTADSSTTELLRNNLYCFLNIDSTLVRQNPLDFVAKRIPYGTIRFSTAELLRNNTYPNQVENIFP